MSYYTGVRWCRRCGRKFYSDCSDICQSCFVAEKEEEERPERLARISGFRLQIELVPSPLWGKNLRSMVGGAVWDKIRREVYEASAYRCSVCGHRGGKLYCHEVWLYDDERHIQKLVGLVALCEWCNGVKHMGITDIDFNTLARHFKRVNGCSYEDFVLARDVAFEVWAERSVVLSWTQDLGEYARFVSAVGG